MIHIEDYFYYIPTTYGFYLKPKDEYKDVLSAVWDRSKYKSEYEAMRQVWKKQRELNLNLNHRFQIRGNFNKDLQTN